MNVANIDALANQWYTKETVVPSQGRYTMTWHVPVAISLTVSFVVTPWLLKKNANLPSRTRRLSWQFGLCAAMTLVIALVSGAPISSAMLIIVGLGAVNSFGAYCQWRAIAISLSKTSLFTWWDDLIAMALGYTLLHETRYLEPFLALGVVISIASVVTFPYVKRGNAEEARLARREWKRLIGWVWGYSVIWGVAGYAMRSFALREIALPSFVASWYTGAFMGSLCIHLFANATERGTALTLRDLRWVFPLSLAIMGALSLKYWAMSLAPLTVLQPFYQVGEMIMPTFVGLVIYKEARSLTRAEKTLFALAISGGAIIALSFR